MQTQSPSDSDFRAWSALIELLRTRLGMYTMQPTFLEAGSVLVGFEVARNDSMLKAFRTWLQMRADDRPELSFMGLVLRQVFPVGESYKSALFLTDDEQKTAIGQLLDDFDAFLHSCEN